MDNPLTQEKLVRFCQVSYHRDLKKVKTWHVYRNAVKSQQEKMLEDVKVTWQTKLDLVQEKMLEDVKVTWQTKLGLVQDIFNPAYGKVVGDD